jgi:ATP-dependent DNA helicase DinG
MDYALPRAQIKLKQGLGRLIRSRSDRGIMAILDNRILQRSYGKYMLKDLPDCQKVMTIEDLHQAGLLYGLLLK